MNGKELYQIWAPKDGLWSNWARVVPFVVMDSSTQFGMATVTEPEILYAEHLKMLAGSCAVVVDLPQYFSIAEGLALAKLGFRPVPLYNGCSAQDGALSVVDNQDIEAALRLAAPMLQAQDLPLDAPPAFLLDTERVHQVRASVAMFDNSWDIYYQDMPSAEFLLKHGIGHVVVHSEKLEKDLAAILYRYQKGGIKLYLVRGYEPIEYLRVKKPRQEL